MNIDTNKQFERDMENAIRARGLKEQMQQWEAERKQSADHPRIPTPAQDEQKIVKRRPLRRTIYSLSAVAVLVGIIVLAVPASTWRSGYRQASRWAYQQYAHYVLRQGTTTPAYEHTIDELMAMATPSVEQIISDRNELQILGHEDLVLDATWQINKGHYAMAQSILEEVAESLTPESTHYQMTKEDIDYLTALCHLGQNRRSKAKTMLTAIAESDSRHREAAAAIVADL